MGGGRRGRDGTGRRCWRCSARIWSPGIRQVEAGCGASPPGRPQQAGGGAWGRRLAVASRPWCKGAGITAASAVVAAHVRQDPRVVFVGPLGAHTPKARPGLPSFPKGLLKCPLRRKKACVPGVLGAEGPRGGTGAARAARWEASYGPAVRGTKPVPARSPGAGDRMPVGHGDAGSPGAQAAPGHFSPGRGGRGAAAHPPCFPASAVAGLGAAGVTDEGLPLPVSVLPNP